MPIGLLEFALVTGGLAGGYTLGSRLRQAAHDDASSADGANTAAAADQPNGPHHLGQNSSSASLHSGLTCTIMLVGEPSVGKSLFLARITSPDGNPGRQAVPKTMVPAWQQADVVLPSQMARQGRVSSAAAAASVSRATFQVLDTPGCLPELCVPFYRGVQCVVLMFDVGQASSFAKLKSDWHAAVTLHRLNARGNRHPKDTTVVLAHVVDERRNREVTRREAAAWCSSVGLPFFETHPAELQPKVLGHLARAVAQGEAPTL